jgi:hypothetical protein
MTFPKFPLDSIPNYISKDFTYYHPLLLPKESADELSALTGNAWQDIPLPPKSVEEVKSDKDCSASADEVLFGDQDVRLLICSCFRRTHLSCTVRRISPVKKGIEDLPIGTTLTTSGYLDVKRGREENLNTADEICTVLRDAIFGIEPRLPKNSLPKAEGLIIITGSTNAGKSILTRGLIHKYLHARLLDQPKRRPHLVTFEDPIEVYFAQLDQSEGQVPTGCFQTGIDYTPRQVGSDVLTLEDAIKDALRQTPEVFYVGEVRDRDNWRELVEFAGTGHLIVTTAHAGSLQEAMGNVFRATKAETPARRSVIAKRIQAVVHLRSEKLPEDIFEKTGVEQMIIPAVWRRTSEGIMGIMEYGLSSVLPDRSRPKKSCLGRAWFIEQLIKAYCTAEKWEIEEFRTLSVKAAGWDLEGR